MCTVSSLKAIAEVIALHDAAWNHSTGIIELLRCSTDCYIAQDQDGEIVAYAFVEFDAQRGHVELQDVVVSPRHRRRALGQGLLRVIMDAYPRIKLIAHANDTAVLGFYEKLGFTRESVVENYYSVGDDGLRMSWAGATSL